ncbi:tigger transposable element-derived protein 1-like [Pteropus medius]|uniref:tigger transposable element-derived protein 1-like n=1 Tax=Pteropus vampyrus TaxID=132908 RepID=UPI00196A36EC|nr:tigger transposable element-derived protein 1-like [Pteropus giganteus]
MEQQLSVWMRTRTSATCRQRGAHPGEARSLSEDLRREQGEGAESEPFGASRVVRPFQGVPQPAQPVGERAIQEGGSTARQVFDVGETGLFWKRLPDRTFLPTEDKSAPGFRAARDLLTLLLGGNAAGDFKLKPLLVNPSENPRALKGFSAPSLPVLWRSHKDAWVTTSLFQEWALLILDSAPGHPGNLDDLSDHVRVEHLPKNSTALLQPLNRDVVATFKVHDLRRVFRPLATPAEGACEPSAVPALCQDYSIPDTVRNISEAWEEVLPATLNRGWRVLWPEGVQQRAGGAHVETLSQIRRDIVELARGAGFTEVAEADGVALLQSCGSDLANEELMALALEQEWGRRGGGHLSKALAHFDAGLQIVSDNDPNLERSLRVCQGINNIVNCYRELLREKRGPKQGSWPTVLA